MLYVMINKIKITIYPFYFFIFNLKMKINKKKIIFFYQSCIIYIYKIN